MKDIIISGMTFAICLPIALYSRPPFFVKTSIYCMIYMVVSLWVESIAKGAA